MTGTHYLHPHEVEEMEMRLGPRMWDATPGVCCAYFQTGACPHTEAMDWEYELSQMDDAEQRYPAWTEADPATGEVPDDEPF